MYIDILLQTCEKFIHKTIQELYDVLSIDELLCIEGYSESHGGWSLLNSTDVKEFGDDIITTVISLDENSIYIRSVSPYN